MKQLRLHGYLTVRRLRFPFAVECETGGDNTWGSSAGRRHQLRPGRTVRLPPLTSFDLQLAPREELLICLPRTAPEAAPQAAARKPLRLVLAEQVFSQPAAPWSRDLLAQRLGLTPLEISRRLFREGESFPHLVRTQRLMRLFADCDGDAAIDADCAASYGYTDMRRLARHFAEQFDLSLTQLQAARARPRPRAASPGSQPARSALAAMYLTL